MHLSVEGGTCLGRLADSLADAAIHATPIERAVPSQNTGKPNHRHQPPKFSRCGAISSIPARRNAHGETAELSTVTELLEAATSPRSGLFRTAFGALDLRAQDRSVKCQETDVSRRDEKAAENLGIQVLKGSNIQRFSNRTAVTR